MAIGLAPRRELGLHPQEHQLTVVPETVQEVVDIAPAEAAQEVLAAAVIGVPVVALEAQVVAIEALAGAQEVRAVATEVLAAVQGLLPVVVEAVDDVNSNFQFS